MKSRIKLLPDHVANQIAAGEVVQRPASVVKELMENALDAGADDIKLIIKDGGKSLIQVVDNGMGMNEMDARMAFERHATSKISSAEDLFHINSKGFRGEALASIAAVAHVTLKTKTQEAELGQLIRIEGSKIVAQELIATQKGTAISVKNLFFNIPARRKFLKSIQVEMRHINDEFYRLALAHHQVAFTMIHNGNVLYQFPKSNLLQRISNLFGSRLEERLVPVSESTDYIKITGYVGSPEFAKKKRGEQFFFVNNRFIKSAYLNHALLSAYEGLIQEKSYPSYFVFFELDPKHIDVNIHPTKTEIKFDDEQTVYSILKVAVKHSLGQFNLSPSMDFNARPDLDIPYEYTKKTPKTPKINVNPDFNPFAEEMPDRPAKVSPRKVEKKLEYWETLMNESKGLSDQIAPTPEFITVESNMNRAVFQLDNRYLVTSHQDKLVLIHQARAHQKILFHQLLQQLQNNGFVPAQQLIFPIELMFPSDEIALLQTQSDTIKLMGFDIEFNDTDILVNAVPLDQKKIDVTEFFQELLHQLREGFPVENQKIWERMAMIIAKKSAIKSGKKLQVSEMEKIVQDLYKLPNHTLTEDGKKIIIATHIHDISLKFD